MAMFKHKKPMLFDLNTGCTGTFIGKEEDPTEPGNYYVHYMPLGFNIKNQKYKHSIPDNAINHVPAPDNTMVGVEDEYVIIFDPTKPSLVESVEMRQAKRVNDLKQQVEQLKLQSSTARQSSQEALGAQASMINKMRDMRRATQGHDGDREPNYMSKYEDF